MLKRYFQLPFEKLVQQTVERNEGILNNTGALVINTGEFTGRSPDDKFIVKDSLTEDVIDWNRFNKPISNEHFLQLKHDVLSYLENCSALWTRYAYAGANPAHRIGLKIVNETPAGNHFAANMFIAPTLAELENMAPEWTILHAPGFIASPPAHGTRQGNFTVISFTHQIIIIGGSAYTGELKKAVFTVFNFILPFYKNVLTMHCSANEGKGQDTALFFGLSGTGKTTLSSDPGRHLIGDDEHGWDNDGIFNLEGGCYAKVINLCEKQEPSIFNAIKPGALVENTRFFEGTNQVNFSDKTITENTRVSYPVHYITAAKEESLSGQPKNIFFLTCDSYGLFPPLSKLSAEQALYFFLSGYTAKIAGTENGITEPKATFSACFGAPFLPLNPKFYARLLKEKLNENKVNVWMVNTGWTGGSYGIGKRIAINHSRALISAALSEELDNTVYKNHPVFPLAIPQNCPGVPQEILNPWETWADQKEYFKAAEDLAMCFEKNYHQLSEAPAEKLQTVI